MLQSAVPLTWLRDHLTTAGLRGLSAEDLVSKYAPQVSGDTQPSLTSLEQLAIMLELIVSLDDESHGCGGKRTPIGYNSLALRTMMPAETAENGIEALSRFMRLTAGSLQLEIKRERDHVDLILAIADRDGKSASYQEVASLWTLMCLSWLTGERLRPHALLTANTRHPCLGRRHWAFDAPVIATSYTGLRLPRSLLALPFIKRSDAFPMTSCMGFFMDNEPTRTHASPGMSRNGLGTLHWNNETRFDGVCAEMAVNPWMFRRQLKAWGTGFRELRQKSLVSAICNRMLVTGETAEKLAEHFGFAEARSLRRMVKASTGMTIQQLRAHLTQGPQVDTSLKLRCLQLAKKLDS